MTDKFKELENSFDKDHRVILITGDMTSGKSNFINEFVKSKNSIIFNTFNFEGHFITDLANHFADSFPSSVPNSFSETKYNSNRFQEFLTINKESKEDLYNKIIEKNLIKSNIDYFKNKNVDISEYEETFINKSDNKLVWSQGKVVVESLLVDLISLLYPNSFGDLSKITPHEVIFVFDEIDHILKYIDDNFISNLIEYLEAKISKFENYDFTKDKDIKLSEVLDIRIIVCSRNKSFEKYQTKIELESKFVADDDGGSIVSYINSLKEFDENPYTLAEELFFKYSTNFERNFLSTAILMKKFDSLSFDLFPELEIKDDIIEHYITNFYYINKINDIYDVDSIIYKFLYICYEKNNSFLLKELVGRANLNEFVIKFIQKLNKEDFEYFRKLAYFNYFDLNNAITGVFPQTTKKYVYLLDKYKHLLNKNNFHLSLKKEYSTQLDNYNKIIDQTNYPKLKAKVKFVWNDTKKVLFDRKSELTGFVDKTNKSIKDYIEELSKFNQENDNIEDILTKEQNNLKEIENILVPYTHKRPVVETLGITIVSIVLLLLSFINIFSISETDTNIFFSILEWLFRIIGLLGILFVSKSLIRIYKRIKDKEFRKSQELHYKEIEKNIKDQNDVKSLIQADIKATNAKIQELEADITNYKSQLEEIEQKLNEPFV